MRMTWPSLLNEETAVLAGVPLANSSALTDISALPNYILEANFCATGSTFLFRAGGVFSTTSTPTLTLGVYWGGIAGAALGATAAVTTSSGVTNVPWQLELWTGIRSKGSGGTAFSFGWAKLGSSVSAFNTPVPIPGTANTTVAVDTTTSKALTIGAQWGTPSASNTITCHGFYIFSIGL